MHGLGLTPSDPEQRLPARMGTEGAQQYRGAFLRRSCRAVERPSWRGWPCLLLDTTPHAARATNRSGVSCLRALLMQSTPRLWFDFPLHPAGQGCGGLRAIKMFTGVLRKRGDSSSARKQYIFWLSSVESPPPDTIMLALLSPTQATACFQIFTRPQTCHIVRPPRGFYAFVLP